jgi:sugar phosphate isomerase/epimerase
MTPDGVNPIPASESWSPASIGVTACYPFALYGRSFDSADLLSTMKQVANAGFTSYELMAILPEHLQLYEEEKLKALTKAARDLGLDMPLIDAMCCTPDLHSLQPERRQHGLDTLRQVLEIAESAAIPLVHLTSEWPEETDTRARSDYVGAPPEVAGIPPGRSWVAVWYDYLETMARAVELAAEYGRRLVIEPRPNTMVPNVEAFGRLDAELGDPDVLGVSLDFVHTDFTGQDVAAAIWKAGRKLYRVEMADSDGDTLRHLPIGRGNLDWVRIIKALAEVDYAGPFNLDLIPSERVLASYVESRNRLGQAVVRALAG